MASRGVTFLELVMVNWHCTCGCFSTLLPVVCDSHCTIMSMFAPWKLNWIWSLVPPGELVLVPADKGAEGIHGPVSLPPESDFDDDEALSELDGGEPRETPAGRLRFLGELCANTCVGEREIISAAIKPSSAVAPKKFSRLWMVVFIGGVLLQQAVAAVTGKNRQFLFLPVLLDQHAIDADAEQLDVIQRIALLHQPGLPVRGTQKRKLTRDAQQRHRQRAHHRAKNCAVRDFADARFHGRRKLPAPLSGRPAG